MAKQFQVVGACVTDIPVSTDQGPMRTTVYKGAVLSSDVVPAARIEHLLSVGLIEELGKGEEPTPPEAEAGARPANGGEPKSLNSRSSKGDLVEHAVATGDMSREDAEALNRDQLLEKYVRQQDPPPAQ